MRVSVNYLPPMPLREMEVRWRADGNVRAADQLLRWREQASRWLMMEAAKALRSARSWERKGKPEVAIGWNKRAEFCEKMNLLFGAAREMS